ncbi:DUF1236 domain-containing protein [Xanthobacter sp. KR7-65]|uniref:DUF1236 domain-containing protein n=1 Tax=Xanthobacter sp. KR7-65 TaxID=3156612 RepID=UPI0032B58621
MRKALLACTGMTFALLATTAVVAQTPGPQGGATPQGAQSGTAPSGEMRGTKPATGAESGAERATKPDATPGAASPRAQDMPAGGAAGNRNAEGQREPGTARDAQNPSATPNRNAQQQRDGDKPAEQRAGKRGDLETTGSVDITAEKRTTIHQSITRERIAPVRDVNFSINVGVEVPRTVELRALPASVIEVVPQYRGYRFFVLADGRIVIVQPTTYKIVTIIAA